MSATPFKPFMTRTDFAAHIGCAKSYITKLGQQGRLVMGTEKTAGMIDVEKTKALIEKTSDPARQTIPQSENRDEEVGKTYHASRAVKEKYLALAARRDYEKSIKLLVDAQDAYYHMAAAMTMCRASLERMPSTISHRLIGLSDENKIQLILSDYIEEVLNNTSAEIDKMAKD